jgi:hypothetical protein
LLLMPWGSDYSYRNNQSKRISTMREHCVAVAREEMNMVAGNAVRSIYHAASRGFIADVSEYLFCPPFVSLSRESHLAQRRNNILEYFRI